MRLMHNNFTPSVLKVLCKKYSLTPSKRYGQNFLISDAPVKKMVDAGNLGKEDTVLEIGPGFGILTFALAPFVKKIIAYEIEKKLQPYWEEKQKQYANIEIIWGNALKEIGDIRDKKYKVIANLPYQITSHALRTLLELENKPEQIIVMVQKEVAERICATPGGMSLLSVSVQYYGDPEIIAKVPKGNFWPQPKVDSAVLSITNIKRESPAKDSGVANASSPKNKLAFVTPDEEFFKVVKIGFSSKRKQLFGNLSKGLNLPKEKIKKAILDVAGNEKIRAEELGIEDWIELYKHLNIQTYKHLN